MTKKLLYTFLLVLITGGLVNAQEIQISGNGNVINSGDTTPIGTDNTNFGVVPVGTPVSKNFTVENLGILVPLFIGTPGFNDLGSGTIDWSATNITPNPIGPGGTRTLTITINATTPGVQTVEFTLPNGDANENPYTFYLTAEGVIPPAPEILISGNSVEIPSGDTTPSTSDDTDFGTTSIGTPITKQFTITNTGNADLNLGLPPTFNDLGSGTSDWSTTSPPFTIVPSGTATFDITFTPTSGGVQIVEFSLANNDPDENPYTFYLTANATVPQEPDIEISGNGTVIADGDTSPSPGDDTDFGTTMVGTPITKQFTVTNTGNDDLFVNLPPVFNDLGGGTGDWSSTDPDFQIVPSGTSTFDVTFAPSAAGAQTVEISLSSNDPDESPYTFYLTANATVPQEPDIEISGNGTVIADGDTSPSPGDDTDFGTTMVGTPITKQFTVTNTGNDDLFVNLPPVFNDLGGGTGDWSSTDPDFQIVPSGTSTFDVTFAPSAAGAQTVEISLSSNDPDESPYTFYLTANATVPQEPDIEISGNGTVIADGDTSPSPGDDTDFGTTMVGTPITKQFTITNTGNQNLAIQLPPSFNDLGSGITDWSSTNPDFQIPPSGTSTFDVTFTPTVAGSQTVEFSLGSTDPDENPYTFYLTANATLPPDIEISGNGTVIPDGDTTPAAQDNTDFGTTIIGTPVTKQFTVANTGDDDLFLSLPPAFNDLGSGTTDWSTTNPAFQILPDSTSVFEVTFTPTTAGTQTVELSLGSNDPDENPYTFYLTAEGVLNEPEILISGNGQEIVSGDTTPNVADDTDFGDADINTGSVTHTFTIENQGVTDLNLTDPSPYVVISGTHASDFTLATIPSTPIASNSSTTFSITFDPSALGIRTATVSIANDDADENPYTFAIQGNGIDTASGSPLLITQYYEGIGSNDNWIEVKNISTSNVIPDSYYLALFLDARATINGGIETNIPTESVAIPFLAPGDVAIFHRSGATLPGPANLGSAAAVVPTEVCRFDGNDVILISGTNDNNTYNERIDIIGTVGTGGTVNWGVDKAFVKGCGTTEFPATTYTGDYLELSLDDVNNANPATNIALGTQTVGPTVWTSSWNNGAPDITKVAIVNGTYTAADGSFEACNLLVNGSGNLNLDGGTTNYVSIEHDLTVNGAFIIGDTESLITVDGNGTITGNITKKETTTTLNNYYDFTYWSSPVENANLGTVFAGVERIFQWVVPQTGNPWQTEDDVWEPASGIMQKAKGYIAEAHPSTPNGGTYTVSFTGKPHNGVIPIALGINDDGPTPDNDFNLIGNPYPSAIDIDEFIMHSINTPINGGGTDGTIWVWTHNTPISNGTTGSYTVNDYATYNLVGGSSTTGGAAAPTYNIGSSQGFFVRAVQAGDVNFENFMRLNDENDQFFKPTNDKKSAKPEKDRMWLNVNSATGGAFSQVLIGFMEGATDGVDVGYDALRLSAGYLNFYSTIDSLKYAIQGVGSFNLERKFNLGIDTYINKEMEYSISLGNVEGQLSGNDIYLVDNELNVVHDLNQAPYKFTLSGSGKHMGRFTLQFTNAVLDVDDFGIDNNFYIVNEENSLQIKSNNVIERLKVYDVTGRLLIDQKPDDSNFNIPTHNIRKGTVLILNATFSNGAEISKKGIKY